MDKLGNYRAFLAILTVCDCVISASVALLMGKFAMVVALVTVVSQSTVGIYLAGEYKEETYRVIARDDPGSYRRLLREGETFGTPAVPYPRPVEALLAAQRRYRDAAKYLIWAPLIVYGIVTALCH